MMFTLLSLTLLPVTYLYEGREETIRDVYEKLKQNAQIRIPLEPCSFSELMVDLTDQFGVRWCLFL